VVAGAGGEPTGWWLVGLAILLVALLSAANIIGVRWGSRIQNLTVYTKLLALLAVAVVALFATGDPAPADASATTTGGFGIAGAIAAGLVACFFSYGGWQHALWIAGEVRRPSRTLPIAIVGGVAIVTVIYLIVNWAYFALLGHEGVATSKAIATDAVSARFPQVGGRLVAAAVAISAFGVLNAQLLSGPRLVYGMARDGRFFRVFGRVHRRFGTPDASIALLSIMAVVILVTAGQDGVDRMLTGVVFIDGVFFGLTGAALIVLRTKRPDAERPARVPLYPVLPAAFVLGELAIVVGTLLDPGVRDAAFIGAAWIAAGAVLYLIRFHERPVAS